MNKSQELKQNAENCADLAAEDKEQAPLRAHGGSLECACKNAGLA